MEIRPIRNDDDHREALKEIERLWDFSDESPENDKLDVLAPLVEAYEENHWPARGHEPRDVTRFGLTVLRRD